MDSHWQVSPVVPLAVCMVTWLRAEEANPDELTVDPPNAPQEIPRLRGAGGTIKDNARPSVIDLAR